MATPFFARRESIVGPRLLGISADVPALAPNDTSEISALVTTKNVRYAWSWCPRLGSFGDGAPCHLGHDELQAFVDEKFGAGMHTIPAYDLGAAPVARIVNNVSSEVWKAMCAALALDNRSISRRLLRLNGIMGIGESCLECAWTTLVVESGPQNRRPIWTWNVGVECRGGHRQPSAHS